MKTKMVKTNETIFTYSDVNTQSAPIEKAFCRGGVDKTVNSANMGITLEQLRRVIFLEIFNNISNA